VRVGSRVSGVVVQNSVTEEPELYANTNSPRYETLDDAEEAALLELSAGEDHLEVVGAEGFGDGFAEDLAEVGGDG